MTPARAYQRATNGAIFDGGNAGQIHTCTGVRLVPAAAVATLSVVDADGTIVCVLQAAANGNSDECRIPFQFKRSLTITITGAGANALAYVP